MSLRPASAETASDRASATGCTVALLMMPFGPSDRPSLGLSLLAQCLNDARIAATVFYPNLDFDRRIGAGFYRDFGYALARLRALLGLSGGFSILRILDSASMHLLPLVVGAFAGVGAVGLWDRAFVLAFLPLEALAASVGQVLFSVYGRLADDPDRLRRAWSSVIVLATCLLGGLAVGVAMAAPLIVAVVLGPDWVAAAEPLRLLSFWALLRTLSYIAGSLCEARGWLLPRGLLQLAYLLALGATLAVTRPTDLVSVIEVLLAVEAVSQTALLVMASRSCGAAPLAVLSSVLSALMPALLVGAGTAGVTALARAVDLPSPLALAAAMAAGARWPRSCPYWQHQTARWTWPCSHQLERRKVVWSSTWMPSACALSWRP